MITVNLRPKNQYESGILFKLCSTLWLKPARLAAPIYPLLTEVIRALTSELTLRERFYGDHRHPSIPPQKINIELAAQYNNLNKITC